MNNGESPTWITHPVVWASGLAGALVSLTHSPQMNLRQRVFTLGTGVLAAGFVTPALADYFALTLSYVALVGFVVGIVGMNVTAIVVNCADSAKRNPEAALRWFAVLTGRKLPDSMLTDKVESRTEVDTGKKDKEAEEDKPKEPLKGGGNGT